MRAVVNLETFGQIEAGFELSSDLEHGLLVLIVGCPQADAIALWTNVHRCAAHVRVVVEGFADETQDLK